MKWYSPQERLPEPGTLVAVMLSSNEESTLVYNHNLWWLPDMSMYVYFIPRLWRYQ